MTYPSRQRVSRCQPASAGWWMRLFAALLFAFYVNYVPIHLVTARHLDDLLESSAPAAFHHHDHDDGDHDADHHGDNDHHAPHPASDHTLNLTAQTQAPTAAFAVFYLLPVTQILICEPEPQPPIPVFERARPPGESPPDPLQPRAPPLA